MRILAIRGATNPYPQEADDSDPDDRAQVKVLDTLMQHPEWLNRLEELHLDVCSTPDQSLLDFVTTRTGRDLPAPCATLKRLALRCGTRLAEDTQMGLKEVLDAFEYWGSEPRPKPQAQGDADA